MKIRKRVDVSVAAGKMSDATRSSGCKGLLHGATGVPGLHTTRTSDVYIYVAEAISGRGLRRAGLPSTITTGTPGQTHDRLGRLAQLGSRRGVCTYAGLEV